MKVLLDTNVILDVLLRQGQWLAEAEVVWQASTDGRLESCATASSLTDIYYISPSPHRKRGGATNGAGVPGHFAHSCDR